ncbi:LysM domain-containing protein [Microbacterium ureisolvens]|uniref:LysM domain-containing protein n=1 Tax=Microbacterium ureisolvens TaxID=2781186 RepID=UPI00363875EE
MFDHTSRYHGLEVATLDLPDGRTVSYVRRRFLPQGASLPLLAEVTVAQGERIDLVAHRTLGDPLAYWRICDANDAMDPQALARDAGERPARLLRVPLPGAPGRT